MNRNDSKHEWFHAEVGGDAKCGSESCLSDIRREEKEVIKMEVLLGKKIEEDEAEA